MPNKSPRQRGFTCSSAALPPWVDKLFMLEHTSDDADDLVRKKFRPFLLNSLASEHGCCGLARFQQLLRALLLQLFPVPTALKNRFSTSTRLLSISPTGTPMPLSLLRSISSLNGSRQTRFRQPLTCFLSMFHTTLLLRHGLPVIRLKIFSERITNERCQNRRN